MDLPNPVLCDNAVRETPQNALAMLLHCLAYPSHYSDIYQMFGCEHSQVSRVRLTFASYLYSCWLYLLHFHHHPLLPAQLKSYTNSIPLKGAPLTNCCGSIDGTLHPIACPVWNQQIVYTSRKRCHAIKFHTIVTTDGLVSHLYGPVEGRRHDETLYKESGLANLLEQHSFAPDGSQLVIYGDPAYGLSTHLISPYTGLGLPCEEHQFNSQMSAVWESVEWGFNQVIPKFGFLDYKKNLRVLLQPVRLLYAIATPLCNAHTILHRSQTSVFFDCTLPTHGEYFHRSAKDAVAFLNLNHNQGDVIVATALIAKVDISDEDYAAMEAENRGETYEDIVL